MKRSEVIVMVAFGLIALLLLGAGLITLNSGSTDEEEAILTPTPSATPAATVTPTPSPTLTVTPNLTPTAVLTVSPTPGATTTPVATTTANATSSPEAGPILVLQPGAEGDGIFGARVEWEGMQGLYELSHGNTPTDVVLPEGYYLPKHLTIREVVTVGEPGRLYTIIIGPTELDVSPGRQIETGLFEEIRVGPLKPGTTQVVFPQEQ